MYANSFNSHNSPEIDVNEELKGWGKVGGEGKKEGDRERLKNLAKAYGKSAVEPGFVGLSRAGA